MDFPSNYNDLSSKFLSKALGKTVEHFEVDHSMTAGGVLADAYRVFDIQYESGIEGPTSLFIKSTKTIPEIVELCKATGVYAKEVYFYSHLHSKVSQVIRVPQCFAIYTDSDDADCSQFCIVMEDFNSEEWTPFEQITNPMKYGDMSDFMTVLAKLHGHFWGEPVRGLAGLGAYRAHWQSLNDDFVVEAGTTAWHQLLPKWEAIYGKSLLLEVDEPVRKSIEQIAAILNSDDWMVIQDKILADLQTRPRTITHGDARGNNIFRSKIDDSIGFIDWQMWVAGPASNEFSQVWMNSFAGDSGMVERLEELTQQYYDVLLQIRPDIQSEYPFDTFITDIKLIFINMWVQYIGFSLGSVDGYADPEQADAKENWRILMKRNMETLHLSNALMALESYIAIGN